MPECNDRMFELDRITFFFFLRCRVNLSAETSQQNFSSASSKSYYVSPLPSPSENRKVRSSVDKKFGQHAIFIFLIPFFFNVSTIKNDKKIVSVQPLGRPCTLRYTDRYRTGARREIHVFTINRDWHGAERKIRGILYVRLKYTANIFLHVKKYLPIIKIYNESTTKMVAVKNGGISSDTTYKNYKSCA